MRGKKAIPLYRMSVSERRDWGTVALRVYGHLAARTTHRDSFEHSAMLTRLRLIRHLGASAGDPICNPHLIITWFFDRLTMTPTLAKTRAREARRTLDRKGLLELSQLRVRSSVVRLVTENDPSFADPRLEKCLDIEADLR